MWRTRPSRLHRLPPPSAARLSPAHNNITSHAQDHRSLAQRPSQPSPALERARERAQTRYLARVCGVQALLGIVVRHVLDGRIGKHLFRTHYLVCAHRGGLMRRAGEAPGIQAEDTTGTPMQNKSATTIFCCLWWFFSYPDAHGHVAFPEGERPLLRDDARQ